MKFLEVKSQNSSMTNQKH